MKKLMLLTLVLCGMGCHHRQTTLDRYPPVFAPPNVLAAYKSSQTGYLPSGPR